MAEHFINYFSIIAKNIDAKIVPTNTNYKDYLRDFNSTKTFFLEPVTPEEVKDYISTLNTCKSSEPYSIPSSMLRMAKETLCIPLAEIFNSPSHTED